MDFQKCYYNGLTNLEISRFLKKVIEKKIYFLVVYFTFQEKDK